MHSGKYVEFLLNGIYYDMSDIDRSNRLLCNKSKLGDYPVQLQETLDAYLRAGFIE